MYLAPFIFPSTLTGLIGWFLFFFIPHISDIGRTCWSMTTYTVDTLMLHGLLLMLFWHIVLSLVFRFPPVLFILLQIIDFVNLSHLEIRISSKGQSTFVTDEMDPCDID